MPWSCAACYASPVQSVRRGAWPKPLWASPYARPARSTPREVRCAADGRDATSGGLAGWGPSPLVPPEGLKIERVRGAGGRWVFQTKPASHGNLSIHFHVEGSWLRVALGRMGVMEDKREVLHIGVDGWSYKAPGAPLVSGTEWELVQADVVEAGTGADSSPSTALLLHTATYEGYISHALGDSLEQPLTRIEQEWLAKVITAHIDDIRRKSISWVERNAFIQSWKAKNSLGHSSSDGRDGWRRRGQCAQGRPWQDGPGKAVALTKSMTPPPRP